MALGCAAVTRSPRGAPACFPHCSVAHQGGEGLSPAPRARRGVRRSPCEWRGSAKEPGLRLPLGVGSVLRPKMAPGRCLLSDCGATRARGWEGGKDQREHRAAGSSEEPARAPTHAAARRTGTARLCPAVPPGARQGTGSRRLRDPKPCARGAGMCAGKAAQGRWGPQRLGGGWPGEGGLACTNCGPNEIQARFATPTKRTLGNANAIGKSRANRQNFY